MMLVWVWVWRAVYVRQGGSEGGMRPDAKLFNKMLLGISLQPKPSTEMASRVLELMDRSGVAPTQHTYTTLLGIYVGSVREALPLLRNGLGNQPTPPSRERAESGRAALMQALSIYLSMRLRSPHASLAASAPTSRHAPNNTRPRPRQQQQQQQQQHASSTDTDTHGTVTFNSLLRLVGTEAFLGVSDRDIDALHTQLARQAESGGPSRHPPSAAAAAAAERGGTRRGREGKEGDAGQEEEEEEEEWTRLPLAELRERYRDRPLPLRRFVPVECVAAHMTPLELLLWRDLAADGAHPNCVSYNHLILHLTAAGRISHAEHYLRYVLRHQLQQQQQQLSPSFAMDGGAPPSDDLLARRHNLKYSSTLIKQRQDRRAQFSALLAKTPRPAQTAADPSNEGRPQQQQQGKENRGEEIYGQLLARSDWEQEEVDSPLFLRTLLRVGGGYLEVRRFDDFVGCYRLAKQSYPLSAAKCFGFLLQSWRTPAKHGAVIPDARAESALQAALRKHAIADPSLAAGPPAPAPTPLADSQRVNAFFQ
jgi:hypothetical protein